jgi:NAD(P)-dependent dehydrogenase (short-subunit alcohol dehydrogenase family)
MAVWFITGCSAGFGRSLAERVHARGDNLVATARSLQALGELGAEDENRVLRQELDVTDRQSIREAVNQTLRKFGRIDVLVNNAGYGYFATQEEGELDEVRKMFDTNVFGLLGVTQEIVPLMREQGSGAVVNVSSVAGRIATPRGGFYQASKWAVEALSEALYLEESSFGVRVIIIEPGSYDTNFAATSMRYGPPEDETTSPFTELRETWSRNAKTRIWATPRQDPMEVVDAIWDSVASGAGFLRIPVGRDAAALIQRRQEMGPADFVEWIRQQYHRLE